MIEKYKYRPPEILGKETSIRDYTRSADVASAIERLVAGLKEDGDEFRMFEIMGQIINQKPDVLMPVIQGSILLAEQKLGQNRKSGSSATLLYPVDAAIRVLAKRLKMLNEDPLSAESWDASKVIDVLQKYPSEIVDLAGSNTTSKNLPQRAAHILWLLDQCPIVQTGQKLSLLEIGASGGLIIDALKQPKRFQSWMEVKGYRSDFAQKSSDDIAAVLGIDLVKPDLDWLQAVILEDELRDETTDFISIFDRSPVITESATNLSQSTGVSEFLKLNQETLPVIFSCFVFYQLDEETRTEVTNQARSLLKKQGGGLLIISDIAKYRGFLNKAGGCASWIEDQDGNQVSPKILLSKSTLTEWEEV